MFHGIARNPSNNGTEDLRRCLSDLATRHSEYYRRLANEPNLQWNPSAKSTVHLTENSVFKWFKLTQNSRDNVRANKTRANDISSGTNRVLSEKSFNNDKFESSLGFCGKIEVNEEPLASYESGSIKMLPTTVKRISGNSDPDRQLLAEQTGSAYKRCHTGRLSILNGQLVGHKIGMSSLGARRRGSEDSAIERSVKYKLKKTHRSHSATCVQEAGNGGKYNNNTNKNNYNDTDTGERCAINNKNKMHAAEEWDRSNYLKFVPATSLDRFGCATFLARSCNNHRSSSAGDDDQEGNIRSTTNGTRSRLRHTDPRIFCSPECNGIIHSSRCMFKSLVQQRKKDLLQAFSKDICHSVVHDQCEVVLTNENSEKLSFPCVESLVKMYSKLLDEKKTEFAANPVSKDAKMSLVDETKSVDNKQESGKINVEMEMNRSSPILDEGCPAGQSPYSSDIEEIPPEEVEESSKEKVIRSSSSDSALGLEDDGSGGERSSSPTEVPVVGSGRRMTLTVADIPLRPALLPLAEPILLPDSPTSLEQIPPTTIVPQTAIPSKVLLEERVVEIPEDRFGGSLSNSRRESAQSCISDYNSEFGVRYVRTPSVVVSDYSDDVMCGITLEEIEYFRQHRMRRRSSADTNATEKDETASDVSAASSCSNLYYCGSTISALDGADCYINGIRMSMDRKISDCSTCSTISGDEDDDTVVHEFQNQFNEQQNRIPKKH